MPGSPSASGGRGSDDARLSPCRRASDGSALHLGARRDTLAALLSHGERRQLELAMALASHRQAACCWTSRRPGMGPEESPQLVARLRRCKGVATILLVEHDMDTVFALADRITVLV